jgi:hypothetical protein
VGALSLLASASAAFGAIESPAARHDAVVLEGSVSNESGEPLVGALVSVFGSNLGGGGLIAFTDEKGRFLVSDLEPGLYTIRAYLSGFLPSSYSRVEVDDEGVTARPVSMQLASSDDDREDGPAELSPSDQPSSDSDQKVAEFQWLLRHGKKNILHQEAGERPEVFDPAADEKPVDEVAAYAAYEVAPSGELGLYAFERGVHDFPTTPGQVDGQLAYARLNIPAGPASQWIVSAQLLESALSSWTAQAEYVTEPDSGGRQLSAGVAYGNHLYGDVNGVSPAQPGGIVYPTGSDRTSEWFGSVYGAHRFRVGGADVGAGLTYHHFSYLDRSSYAAPRVDVSWALDSTADTLVRGMLDYRVSAPGGEDLGLLARMVSADFMGTADQGQRGLTAETAVRYQVSVERRLGTDGAVEVRVFQEQVHDPLLKAFLKKPGTGGGPGHYLLMNQGDLQARGVGLAISRQFGGIVGSLGYTFGLGRALTEDVGAFEAGNDEGIHDLTTTVRTEIDQTRTRLLAVYRLSRHPTLAPSLVHRNTSARVPGNLDSRFNLQVHQLLPFIGWNSTQWELMVAVRNLFYENLEEGTFLEEISVIDSPARVLGGVTVHF